MYKSGDRVFVVKNSGMYRRGDSIEIKDAKQVDGTVVYSTTQNGSVFLTDLSQRHIEYLIATTLTLHFSATTRSDELGGESVELPYSKELEDAIMVINSACSSEVHRRKNKTVTLTEKQFDEAWGNADKSNSYDMYSEIKKRLGF